MLVGQLGFLVGLGGKMISILRKDWTRELRMYRLLAPVEGVCVAAMAVRGDCSQAKKMSVSTIRMFSDYAYFQPNAITSSQCCA